MKRNRIGYNDTIKAHAFDANRKIIASVYDSGFTTIESVANCLSNKCPFKKISEIDVFNEDKGWFAIYKVVGRKFVKL